ncbi:MAG: hypothetical protein R3D80_03030 [Paracoccaceae bacterium]
MNRRAALVLGLTFASPLQAEDFIARSGGPSADALCARSAPGTPEGLTFFRPVLAGVLYRAGFKGGDKERVGLSSAQRQTLCGDGFSRAFYADFGKNTDYGATSCASGSLDYQPARSSHPADVMKAV